MKAILTVGISGSGKSTWAEEYCKKNNFVEINRDNIREELFQFENYSDYKFTKANETKVTELAHFRIKEYSEHGVNIVISDTNLNTPRRIILIELLESLGYSVSIKEFPIDFWTAVKRDEKRACKTVGRQVIYRQYRNWLKYSGRKTYEPNKNKPQAYIFDIDGTIANHKDENGKNLRSPFDWDNVGIDRPNESVLDVLDSLYYNGAYIIIMSGRDSICREQTKRWLEKYEVPYEFLFMRPEGDTRKDVIIKEELFWAYIADNYNIMGVFDDRPQVCLLWNELGIPLFKVGDLVEEF